MGEKDKEAKIMSMSFNGSSEDRSPGSMGKLKTRQDLSQSPCHVPTSYLLWHTICFSNNNNKKKLESEHLKIKHSHDCHNSREHCILLEAHSSAARHRHIRANLVECQLYLQFGVI